MERNMILDPGRRKLAEYTMNVHTVNCEMGTTIDDLKTPGYWAHTAAEFKPYDQIWARSEDGTWVAHLMVLGCDRNWAKMHVLAEHKLTTSDVAMTAAAAIQHSVEWKGPQHRFCVIRKSDSETVKSGFADKVAATTWMVEHERTTA
jgi:hypothetical protein